MLTTEFAVQAPAQQTRPPVQRYQSEPVQRERQPAQHFFEGQHSADARGAEPGPAMLSTEALTAITNVLDAAFDIGGPNAPLEGSLLRSVFLGIVDAVSEELHEDFVSELLESLVGFPMQEAATEIIMGISAMMQESGEAEEDERREELLLQQERERQMDLQLSAQQRSQQLRRQHGLRQAAQERSSRPDTASLSRQKFTEDDFDRMEADLLEAEIERTMMRGDGAGGRANARAPARRVSVKECVTTPPCLFFYCCL